MTWSLGHATSPGNTKARVRRSILTLISILAATLLVSAPVTAQEGGDADGDAGLAAWSDIAGVLQHPRCVNCHQADAPLQGEGITHVPRVVRGSAGLGVGPMRCGNCHNAVGNNATAGVPGAPHWSLAPRSMRWQGLDSAELCAQLTDPQRNGDRSDEALLEHMAEDALVLWGWEPGADREPVPVPHDEFVDILETWIAAGTPCPDA